MSSGVLWQSPYVNVFKQFGVGKWIKSTKEGDVSSTMDRDIKATVFRISGSIPASNYIFAPKTSSQSLKLVGTYVFILFKPLPSKYFVIHLEVVTTAGLVVRISLSNLFKEFKSTSTWLQFPFKTKKGGSGGDGDTSSSDSSDSDSSRKGTRWTFLCLNLRGILSKFLSCNFSSLKNIKLCASMLVKNVFTSDVEYSPWVCGDRGVCHLPREMSFPVAKDAHFLDTYNYVRFPSEEKLDALSQQRQPLKGRHSEVVLVSTPKAGSKYAGRVTKVTGKVAKSKKPDDFESRGNFHVVKEMSNGHRAVTPEFRGLADHGIDGGGEERWANKRGKGCWIPNRVEGGRGVNEEGSVDSDVEVGSEDPESVHVYAERGTGLTIHREGDLNGRVKINVKELKSMSLQPDPILKLHRVVGFGGVTTHQALFGEGGTLVVYPCHSLVVAIDTVTGKQRFFIGHTNKVSCISLNVSGCLLASGQTGTPAVVRVWEVVSTRCLAMFQSHHQGLHVLSFSYTSCMLCGVGKDSHGKAQVVLWDTSQLRSMGEVSAITKAHTDAIIEKMRVAMFECQRMVSCGLNNVRFWRLKGGSLRSCPVDLGDLHHMHFTDVQFQPGFQKDDEGSDRRVYASTDCGHLLEINYRHICIERVWRLFQDIGIHCLSLHRTFCVTGSEDGFLRVWPMDFSSVFMEAEHEGEVTAVDISEDGLKVLAGTSAGNLGILDASARSYCTLMRSHVGHVTSMSVSRQSPGHLITCSSDRTIRVWDLTSGAQTFDFRTPEDCATCVCAGPGGTVFACGFQSGAVRVFKLPSATVIAEHSHHSGSVTGVLYSPIGHQIFSCSASGSLALYCCHNIHAPRLLRLLANTVAKGVEYGPQALTLNQDGSRLAFVGPHNFTITVLEADTLNEVLRVDITPVTTSQPLADSAKLVCYSPACLNQLLVVTKMAKLLKFSAANGQLLSEVGRVHRTECSSVGVSENGRYLVTGGDKVVKVWDYGMALDLNFQVFIGHSDEVSEVMFSSSGRRVISCGDAIFIWDFLGVSPPLPSSPSKTTPISESFGLQSASPRKQVPTPASYDSLNMQAFTPIGLGSSSKLDVSVVPHSQSKNKPVLNVDDDDLYVVHGEGQGEGPAININRFREHMIVESSSEEEETTSSDEVDGQEDEDEGKQEEGCGKEVSPDPKETTLPPRASIHLIPPTPRCQLAPRLYVSPKEEAGLRRLGVCSVSGQGSRNSVVWQPSSGAFVFGSGCLVVSEDLANGKQRHMEGHVEAISCLALQHDASTLASASSQSFQTPCEIRIWTLATAKCTKVLTFHSGTVQSMGYSPDDRFLLSIGNYQDGSLALWSASDYSLLAATSCLHPIHAHCWDPHTAYEFVTVGVGERGGGVSFWMVQEDMGGKKCQLKVHEPAIPEDLLQTRIGSCRLEFTSVCYGSQPTVLVGSNNGVVSLWETARNSCLLFWRTGSSEITCMFATANKLLTGTSAGSLELWAIDNSTTPPVVTLASNMEIDNGALTSASFNGKMELGVVGSTSGTAWCINWTELSKLKVIGGHSKKISGTAFSADSALLATSSLDGSVAVWKPDTREQLVLFQAPNKSCYCVTFAPTPATAVKIKAKKSHSKCKRPPVLPALMAGYSDGTVREFDMNKGRMVRKMQPHAEPVRAVAYFSDGNVVVSGCSAGLVAVSNLTSGLVIRVITDHQGAPVTDIQTAPKPVNLPSLEETQCMLCLIASGDRRVSLWSADWHRDLCQLVDWLTFPGPTTAPDGTHLKSKALKSQYDILPPSLARFSPCDPDTVVYVGYGLERTVQFYSISSKTIFRTLYLTHWPTSFAVSPQSHLLAFGSHERVLKLMDYEEGSFQDYTGHHDTVGSIAFSPCGHFLVSTSQSIIHFWDVTLQ